MNIPNTQPVVKSDFHNTTSSCCRSDDPPSPVATAKSMIHHKVRSFRRYIVYKGTVESVGRYGVSRDKRALTQGNFYKHFDEVRRYLSDSLRLTTAEREVVLKLLRLWSYYGQVYPKESFITSQPGCSKATFWRTIRKLQQAGLIETVQRFLIRKKAQISNLYLLQKLILAIAKYLQEHGVKVNAKLLQLPLCALGQNFWDAIRQWGFSAFPGMDPAGAAGPA